MWGTRLVAMAIGVASISFSGNPHLMKRDVGHPVVVLLAVAEVGAGAGGAGEDYLGGAVFAVGADGV